MGAQDQSKLSTCYLPCNIASCFSAMLPPMKSTMKSGSVKVMTKGQITKKLAEHGLKQKASSELLKTFVEIAAKEVKKTGAFSIPGLCRLKTRVKPATKAGTRTMFGSEEAGHLGASVRRRSAFLPEV